MADKASIAHKQIEPSFSLQDEEIEVRISQLKLLCGLLQSPLKRHFCLQEILRIRSAQNAAAMNAAPPLPCFAGTSTPPWLERETRSPSSPAPSTEGFL